MSETYAFKIPGENMYGRAELIVLKAIGEGDCQILWDSAAKTKLQGNGAHLGEWARAGARGLFNGDDNAWESLPASQKMLQLEAFTNSEAAGPAKEAAARGASEEHRAAAQAKLEARAKDAAANGWPGGAAAAGDPTKLSDAELISALMDGWTLRMTHQYGWQEMCRVGDEFVNSEQSREGCGTKRFPTAETERLVKWVRSVAVSVEWKWRK